MLFLQVGHVCKSIALGRKMEIYLKTYLENLPECLAYRNHRQNVHWRIERCGSEEPSYQNTPNKSGRRSDLPLEYEWKLLLGTPAHVSWPHPSPSGCSWPTLSRWQSLPASAQAFQGFVQARLCGLCPWFKLIVQTRKQSTKRWQNRTLIFCWTIWIFQYPTTSKGRVPEKKLLFFWILSKWGGRGGPCPNLLAPFR